MAHLNQFPCLLQSRLGKSSVREVRTPSGPYPFQLYFEDLGEGTKIFDVPLWDLLPARAYTAAILRVCYGVWETLDRQGRSPGTVHEDDLVRDLVGAGLAENSAEICARLCWDVNWSAKNPLSAWLKSIRSFYL